MKIVKKLKNLDKLIAKGKLKEAIKKHFNKNALTVDKASKKARKKIDKAEIQGTKSIKLLKNKKKKGKWTVSKFLFVLERKEGKDLKWKERIKRKWKNGKVVLEEFKPIKKKKSKSKGPDPKTNKAPKPTKAPSKKSGKEKSIKTSPQIPKRRKTNTEPKAKPVTPQRRKSITAPKKTIATPIRRKSTVAISSKPSSLINTPKITVKKAVAEKPTPSVKTAAVKPPVKRRTRTAVKPQMGDNLKLIEGIGPKIESFLKEDGIDTFAKLAKAIPAKITTMMLAKGGTRYNANNPATWPEQAALAADGKMEELKALKLELKNGRRV